MPSDTMKLGNRQATDTAPVTAPHSRPVISPSRPAAQGPSPHTRMACAATAADSASTDPTDRSMPARISTKVMPTAITASAGISLAMVTKVSLLQKYSERKLNSAIMPARTTSRPT
ncbi:hypothetical protein D3C72_1348240 [compost metagenome]